MIVDHREPLGEVIRRFTRRPELRGIFLVDGERKFVGVITRTDLLDFVKVQLGKSLRHRPLRTLKLRSLYDTAAKDVVHKGSSAAYVRPDDNVAKALDLMTKHDLITVPVVDARGRVMGDLTLLEILSKLVSRSRRG